MGLLCQIDLILKNLNSLILTARIHIQFTMENE